MVTYDEETCTQAGPSGIMAPSPRMVNTMSLRAIGALAAVVALIPLTSGSATAPVPNATSSAPADTVEVTLTASATRLSLVEGVETDVYAYDGRIPGPTFEFEEGQHVVVRFRNDLPEATTVHWHGLNLPFLSDGSPFHPVQPGEEYTYSFTIRPGAAGTYWYHPHPNHATGWQVAMGLYGAVVIRAADDPLPSEYEDKVFLLSDNKFDEDGSILVHERTTLPGIVDFENGREGDHLFVNGEELPTVTIRPGEIQRWRFLNVSAGRYYRLALEGQPFVHVGNDGGLFERPVEVDELLLATAERVEVLVRGVGEPGDRYVLRTLPYDRYIPQTRPKDWDQPRDLLVVEIAGEAVDAPPVPERLRPIPKLTSEGEGDDQVMTLTQGFINGKAMDMGRVDATGVVGETQVWKIENIVGMDHPFHLHGFQFQVIERNGVPEPFRSWKDVVNVPADETARFIVRYENYPGKWMFHCHILDHEDHGMMGILEVTPAEEDGG